MTPPAPVQLRRFERADLPVLGRWLADPVVARWWAQDPSAAGLEHGFGAMLDGTDPGVPLLASVGGGPFGFAQRYRLADEPAYLRELSPVLPVGERDAGIDYLIGDPARRGCGLGPALIAAVCADVWAAYPEVDRIVVPVAAANRASWRSLERAGFVRAAEGELRPDNPADPPDHVVSVLTRPSAMDPSSQAG